MQKRTKKNQSLVKDELSLGERLWNQRGRMSEISGQPLGDHYSHFFAAHVLAKGAYGRFRLNPKNIVLMTPEEHMLFDQRTDKAKQMPEFEWVFKLLEVLKAEYNRNKYLTY